MDRISGLSEVRQPMGIPITPPMASIFERRINAAKQIGSKYVFPSPAQMEKTDQ